ncbi:MAG: putative Ig domain-containing protein, partial [Blastocatellia bacterium]
MGRVALRYLVCSAIIFSCIIAVAGLADATTARIPSDNEMVVQSRAIVTGQVVSVESAALDGEYDIYTYVTLKVDRVFKGNITSRQIVLKEPGGRIGEKMRMVFGTPEFSPGERILVYLDTWFDGSLRVHQMFLGKFSIVTDPHSGKVFVDRTAPGSHVELVTGSPNGSATSWMEMRAYLRLVRNKLAATREQARNFEAQYYNGVPVLASPAEYTGKALSGALQPQYHLFSPPVRWFEPDSGQPVTFLLNPEGEPSSRAAADMDAAMNAWSTVSGCSLRVVDGGSTSQCQASGFGIVDFNNCMGFFPPGSSTAILAIGGWNGTFGNNKVINGVSFGQIVSGFVSVNPNDRADLANDEIVQEIVTHEMGHALGMQHSWDPSYGGSPTPVEMDATMYYIAHFDGRAASLRSDDIAGISFVYPAGGSGGPPPLQITTASLPRATVGVSYSSALAATGGTPPYNWSLTPASGPLPPGIGLGSDGLIGGQPSASGIFNLNFQVTDSARMTAQVQLTLQVQSSTAALSITTTTLPNGVTGSLYSATLAASGGVQPYSWGLAAGSGPLPPGLGLSTAGVITGTPASTGTFGFTVQVSDSSTQTATTSLAINVDSQPSSLTITTASLPTATVGVAYSAAISATGGTQPYTWSLGAGSGPLPPGLLLSAGGIIPGT